METRRNRIGNSCLVLFHVARKGEIGGIIRKSVIFSGGEEYLLGILFYGTGGIFEQEIRGIFQCVCVWNTMVNVKLLNPWRISFLKLRANSNLRLRNSRDKIERS